MPEGPEIFMLSHWLNEILESYDLIGHTRVNKNRHLSFKGHNILDDLISDEQKIISVYSKGKKTVMQFNKMSILVSYGLTGTFYDDDENIPNMKNVHFYLTFRKGDNEKKLYYYDPRGFGGIVVDDNDEIERLLEELGPDPITEHISYSDFSQYFEDDRRGKTKIINFLMNQNNISGIGNKWVAEILFATKLHPLSHMNKIPHSIRIKLFENITKILRKASGDREHEIHVYKKSRYGDYDVKILENGGRSVYYVSELQIRY